MKPHVIYSNRDAELYIWERASRSQVNLPECVDLYAGIYISRCQQKIDVVVLRVLNRQIVSTDIHRMRI